MYYASFSPQSGGTNYIRVNDSAKLVQPEGKCCWVFFSTQFRCDFNPNALSVQLGSWTGTAIGAYAKGSHNDKLVNNALCFKLELEFLKEIFFADNIC